MPRRVPALCVCVLLLLLGHAAGVQAQTQSVTLEWDANTEADLAGYVVRWGVVPGVYTGSLDVGKQTTATISGLKEHYRYYIAVQAYNTAGMMSTPSNVVDTGGVFIQTTAAITDPRPGLFWRNATSGELLTWHLNKSAVEGTRALSIARIPDLTWKIVGAGDLNGDGHPDLVWRNDTSGKLVGWLLQNNQVLSFDYLSIGQIPDLAWRIRAVGDLNGDGRADLVWQHETQGSLIVWFMNGRTVTSWEYLSLSRISDLNWKIAAAGDVNGDGRADLIWRNSSTGGVVAWLMNGPRVLNFDFLSTGTVADQNWKVRALRDVNLDGRGDLIWQNTSDGTIVVWYMNSFQMLKWDYLSVQNVPDTAWEIVGGR